MSLLNTLTVVLVCSLVGYTHSKSEISGLSSSETHDHESKSQKTQSQPNIMIMYMDDWGFNDVGYNLNSKTHTPFLDNLAQESGLILEKYYAEPLCAMSRSAFMTGRNPMRFGYHASNAVACSTYGVSLTQTMLPQILKNEFGYSTHMVGKWHLGFFQWEYTPRYRGFDTYAGYYNAEESWFQHIHNTTYSDGLKNCDQCVDNGTCDGVDLRINEEHALDPDDTYGTYWKRDQLYNTLDMVESNAKFRDSPFFIYMAWQASHSPSQAPDEYVELYANETEETRQYMQAQTTLFDDVLKEVITDLKSRQLWDNLLIIVASDNGGEYGYGDNSPLRGNKQTLWEGGVRVPSFVTGGYLSSQRYGKTVSDVRIHVTDWAPTIIDGVLGGDALADKYSMDGTNVWQTIVKGVSVTDDGTDLTDRTLLLNVNKATCNTTVEINGANTTVCGALIKGNHKIIVGDSGYVVGTFEQCNWNRDFAASDDDILGCGAIPDNATAANNLCSYCNVSTCVYNLESDPCEYDNIADDNPQLTQQLLNLLHNAFLEQTGSLGDYFTNSTVIDPDNDDGYWYPFNGSGFECSGQSQRCEWIHKPRFEVFLENEWTRLGLDASSRDIDVDEGTLKTIRAIVSSKQTKQSQSNDAFHFFIDYKNGLIIVMAIVAALFLIWFINACRNRKTNDSEMIDYTLMRSDRNCSDNTYYGSISHSLHP